MNLKRYPAVRTVGPTPEEEARGARGCHDVLSVTWKADAEPARFCGKSRCTGTCGLPALVISGSPELKTYSNVVAFGLMMQGWRVEWTGVKVEVPPEHRSDFLSRRWI